MARYWPEFAQFGKDEIPVLFLLTHQAGLPAVDATLSPAEVQAWDPVIAALEAQPPLWEPGTAHGYHALDLRVVGRRGRYAAITGRSVGTFFAEEIAQPLGLEFWIGLPEEQEHRVSPLVGGVLSGGEAGAAPVPGFSSTLLAQALNFAGAFSEPGWANRRDLACGRGTCGQRHHQRRLAVPPLRRPDRHRRGWARRTDPDQGPGGPGARIVRTFGADQVFASVGFTMNSASGRDSGSPAPSLFSEAPGRSDTQAPAGPTVLLIPRTVWPWATS